MNKKEKILNLFFVLLFSLLIVLTYIFFHTENLRIGYEIENLRKEKERLKEEIEILKVERAMLRNLKRVEKIARDLGMKEIGKNQIMILNFSERGKIELAKGSNLLTKKGEER
jgi:cell division protein FtsL